MKFFWAQFFFIFYFSQGSPWDNLTTNIAVVEFYPIRDPVLTPEQLVLENTKKYLEIIKTAAEKNANFDMIIFPEATLRTDRQTSVEIKVLDNPCDSSTYPEFIKKISCAARNYNVYIVINLTAKTKCKQPSDSQNCKEFGFCFYNTDVIIDRKGNIINTYHKYNLFGEHDMDKPKLEKIVIQTDFDFGLKFGIFTCFDILFKTPAQELLQEQIDGIIFPTYWYSELPFLTAIQTQQMWAYGHDVMFFGAGGNLPVDGTGGSGIYRGSKGTIVEGYVAKGGSKTFNFVSKNGEAVIPPEENIDILSKEMDNFYLATDSSIPEFSSIVMNISLTDHQIQLCHSNNKNHLCCNFTIKISTRDFNYNQSFYTYHLVAFSGIRSFRGHYNGGTEICGIIACLNSSLLSCGHRFSNYENIQWPVTFEKLEITAKFDKSENKTQFPNTLLSSIRPINASETFWIKKEVTEDDGTAVVERTFGLKKAQNRILTFAIYGRNFLEDSPPTAGSTNLLTMVGEFSLLIGVLVVTVIVNRYF